MMTQTSVHRRNRYGTVAALALTICTAFFAAAPAVAGGASEVRVATTTGPLVGRVEEGVSVFRGVPYAQPPVGPLRWRAPQPIAWTQDRQAAAFGPSCYQEIRADGGPNRGGVRGGETGEDCLYLNVWAPAEARGAPIMVWLYGGGGIAGAGSVPAYEGTSFALNGVVLVNLNYRHGSLAGFAHPALTREAGDEGLVGNYHLLDALAAIDWIRANAEAFGGDPANITIFGESAGATMVANLLASPLAKGRFAKAIIQSSGSLPTPAPSLARAEEIGSQIAAAMGLPGAAATVDQLRAIPAGALLANPRTGFGLRTIIDGKILDRTIMDAFDSGAAADIPLILGTNSDEGRLSGTQRVAAHAMSGAPVWQYFFDYVPEWRRPEQPNGVPHAGEIPYVFNTLAFDRAGDRMTAADHAVAEQVHACWIAFARAASDAQSLACADGFVWPARTEANGGVAALFEDKPRLGVAQALKSPPNGAAPGPTSRDED